MFFRIPFYIKFRYKKVKSICAVIVGALLGFHSTEAFSNCTEVLNTKDLKNFVNLQLRQLYWESLLRNPAFCGQRSLDEAVVPIVKRVWENIDRREVGLHGFFRKGWRLDSTLNSKSPMLLWNSSNIQSTCQALVTRLQEELMETCTQTTPVCETERVIETVMASSPQTIDRELALQAQLDLNATQLADFAYGILNHKNEDGTYKVSFSKALPCGYRLEKTYGKTAAEYARYGRNAQSRLETCHKRGFRAVKVSREEDGVIIYSFRGTVPSSVRTIGSDLNLGLSHLRCAENVMQDIWEDLITGRSVTLTGHSLGGGLAEAAAALLRARAQNPILPPIQLRAVTINGFGGLKTARRFLEKAKIKEPGGTYSDLEEALQTTSASALTSPHPDVSYFSQNDPITWMTGANHTGIVKRIIHESSYASISGGPKPRKPAGVLHSHSSTHVLRSLRHVDETNRHIQTALHRQPLYKTEASRLWARETPFVSMTSVEEDVARIQGILNAQMDRQELHRKTTVITVLSRAVHATGQLKSRIKRIFTVR